jgi:hypothetical protein
MGHRFVGAPVFVVALRAMALAITNSNRGDSLP